MPRFVRGIEKDDELLYIRGERKYLNGSERLRFYRAAKEVAAPVARAFCLLMYYTGCRISEGLDLPASGIDVSERVIVFRTLKQRGGERYRAVPAPQELLNALCELRDAGKIEASEPVFHYGRTWGWTRIKECMNRAGLEGIKAAPKGLRHAFAVSCVEEMIPLTDIQDLLGHAKIETTKVYLTLVGKERHTMVSRTWPKGQK